MKTKLNYFVRPEKKSKPGKATKGRNIGKNRSEKETTILCFFSTSVKSFDFEKNRYVTQTTRYTISTGIKIKFSDWNAKKQEPRDISIKQEIINKYNAFGAKVEEAFFKLCEKGIKPTSEELKKAVTDPEYKPLQPEVKELSPSEKFFNAFTDYITQMETEQRHRTIQKYKTLNYTLREYQEENKTTLSFEVLNLRFFEKFRLFLLNKKGRGKTETGLLNDTVSKYLSTLKTFMKWTHERGYHTNEDFKKIKAPVKVKNEIVTLNEIELLNIYQLDLSKDKRLERVRDLFCFGCFTGQRWSDVIAFNKEDIKGNAWIFESVKTKKLIKISFVGFSAMAKDILEKYDYQLPKISDVKFNKYIKEVGELAEFTEEVVIKRESGSKAVIMKKPKYEFMSSHMARRSFVTILLERGCTVFEVMKFTGHSDVKTLMKYENVSHEAATRALERVGRLGESTIRKAV